MSGVVLISHRTLSRAAGAVRREKEEGAWYAKAVMVLSPVAEQVPETFTVA
jgi:hypothetical protein